MTTTPQERAALFITNTRVLMGWTEIDALGGTPETIDGMERVTEANAPIAVYRAAALTRDKYEKMRDLIRLVESIPTPAEVDALRTRLAELEEARTKSTGAVTRAMARAEHADGLYVAERARAASWETNARAAHADTVTAERAHGVAHDRAEKAEHRAGKIIAEAGRWKRRALAAEAEADTLHAAITSAEMRARVAERDRDSLERLVDDKNNVIRQNRETLATERAQRLDAETRIVDAQAKALATIDRIASMIPESIVDAAVHPAFEIETFYSPENIPVIQIDTQLVAGRFRINLNDAPIWDGDPETDDRPGAFLDAVPVKEVARAEIKSVSLVDDGTGLGHISFEVGIAGSGAILGAADFPTVIPEPAATISRQLDEIRELRARAEELEEDRGEARRELWATANALRTAERHFRDATTLAEKRQTDHENATHLAELHQTAYEEMKRLAEQRQEEIESLRERLGVDS